MENLMELLLLFGAIYAGRKLFKRWQTKRAEEAWVKRVLAPGAGLTRFPTAPPPEHDWTQDVQC
jgi:hypothetical protein